jgi:hypothetical protein
MNTGQLMGNEMLDRPRRTNTVFGNITLRTKEARVLTL